MKTLYIECNMGAAGDMLAAALLDLLPQEKRNEALKTLQAAAPQGVEISCKNVEKCGIRGNYVSVLVDGEDESDCEHSEHQLNHNHNEEHIDHLHHHTHACEHESANGDACEHQHHVHHKMSDIVEIVGKMNIADKVKKDVIEVYNLLARAESHAHGKKVEEIHFHEVGNKDAVMDITSVCYLMNLIGADKILASPVNAGSGHVHCAHGIMPVPAPAAEYLLRGIPYYEGNIKSELCTPTGAALLKYYVKSFCPRPVMNIAKTGIGYGKKDFEAPNCVRIFMGEDLSSAGSFSERAGSEVSDEDKIFQLDANIDDMTGEETGFAVSRLFEAGAREVFTTPVCMKKNRPGTLISVICSDDKKNEIVEAFFKHTTTIGIRQMECRRYILERDIKIVKTSAGEVREKISRGYGTKRSKLEFDDIEKIALEHNISFRDAKKMAGKDAESNYD